MSVEGEVTPVPAANLDVDSAAELIGGLFGDEAPEGERKPEPKPRQEREEDEGDADRGAEDGADEVEPEQEPAKADDQEPEGYALSELADAMGLTVEELLSRVKHRVKASGKELEVTLEEALRGYQREEDYTRKTMEVAEMRKSAEQANQIADTYVQQMQQVAAQHGALLQQMEQALMGSYQAEDWHNLRVNDPAEFAARKSEYEAQYNHIQMQKQAAVQQFHQAEAQKQAYLQQVLMPHEQQLLRDAIPEWADEKVADSERKEVAQFLLTSGYKPEEIAQLYDHRSAVIARQAMLWVKQQQKAKQGKEKVKDLPGIANLKPGARKSAEAQARSKRMESLKRLRKTGSITDAVAALPDFD